MKSPSVIGSSKSYDASFNPELFDCYGQANPVFRGETFNPKHDQARLGAQLKRVKECMKDGNWRTLEEISSLTGDQMQSISARLRDFRKTGHTVERRRRGLESRGLFEYKVSGLPRAAHTFSTNQGQN